MGKLLPINENLKVVILAIGVATTFWFFNALSKNYDKIISYPLVFDFNRDSLVVVDPLPSEIRIDVSSGGWTLLRKTFWFNAEPIKIELNNPTDIKFLTKSSLRPIISNQLKELKINYLLTDTIYINIEPEERTTVALVLDSTFIDLEENHRITSAITLTPDSVTIIGPRSIIENVRSPYFLKLSEEDIDDDYDEFVNIPLEVRNIMSAVPARVNAEFLVKEFSYISYDVGIEPMNFPSDSSRYLADPQAKVSFWIEKSLEDDISFSDFNITADLSMMQKRDTTVPLMLMFFPEDALEIEIDPEFIKVLYAQ